MRFAYCTLRVLFRSPSEGEDLIVDYQTLGLSLGRHSLALLCKYLDRLRLCTAAHINVTNHGAFARAAGLVINRQRLSTASGMIFVTLEDETGQINLVVWPWVAKCQRRIVLHVRLLVVSGTVERDAEVVHLIAGRLEDHSRLLGKLETTERLCSSEDQLEGARVREEMAVGLEAALNVPNDAR